ncbi:MAG: DUF748 domain-containing protein [Myxococcota bacterium]
MQRVALRDLQLTADGPLAGTDPFQVSAVGAGLEVHVLRSDLATFTDLPGAGRATLDQTLRHLPAFRLPVVSLVDADLQFTDDRVQPPVTLGGQGELVEIRNFDNVSHTDDPTEVTVRGRVLGAPLDVDGTIEALVWPPDLTVSGTLQGVSLVDPEVARALRRYTGVVVERGTVSASAHARTEGERILGDVTLRGDHLVAASNGWRVGVGQASFALVSGRGHAEDVRARPEVPGPLQQLAASAVDVSWDSYRLVEQGELVASVDAHRPVVVARRPTGGGPLPSRGAATWSLDLTADDGRLVWQDPTTTPHVALVMEPFSAKILDLGTLHDRARWEITGDLVQGGHLSGWSELDAFGGPGSAGAMRAELRASCLPLDGLGDVSEAYLGLRFDRGAADALLSLDDRGGHLQVHGRDLSLGALPLGDGPPGLPDALHSVDVADVDASFRWQDARGPGSRVLTGVARGVSIDVTADGPMPSGDTAGLPLHRVLRSLPTLQVPDFDVDDSRIVLRSPGGVGHDLTVSNLRATVRDLRTGEGRIGDGRVQAEASVAEGRLAVEARVPRDAPATVWVSAEDVALPALDPWTHAATGLDVDAGLVDAVARVSMTDEGAVDGLLDVSLTGADVLQADDLREGFGTWVRSAGAGALVGLLERSGTATVAVPIGGTVDAPTVRVGRALGRAVLRRFGLVPPLLPPREPLPLPPRAVPELQIASQAINSAHPACPLAPAVASVDPR